MTKQKNIALIAWGHSLAHIVRLIEIIDSLKKISANQTLKLSVIGAGKYLENNNILDQTIYNLIKIDQKISPTHQAENIRAGKFDFYNSASELNEMVQSYIYAFRSLKDEDVYIVDNPDQACIVAIDVLIGLGEMDASKIVYLTNINWTLYRGMPFRVPSNHFAGEIFKNIAYKIGGEKAEKRIENFINSYIVALWAPIQLKMGTKNPNKVFKKLIEEESGKRTTLKKYNDLRETINGTQGLILFADLELFDPPSSKGLPENAKYIGPLPYNYPGEIPQQLNRQSVTATR